MVVGTWLSSSPLLSGDHPLTFAALARTGESGLGKSTLVNTLFETQLYGPKQLPGPGVDRGKTVQIESISAGE
jgi:septin family protein